MTWHYFIGLSKIYQHFSLLCSNYSCQYCIPYFLQSFQVSADGITCMFK